MFHLLQGFMQTHKNTVHYNTLGLQCNVLMSCCFRYFSLLTRRTLAIVLGYKVHNCYALSVTHFIRRLLRSNAVNAFYTQPSVRIRVNVSININFFVLQFMDFINFYLVDGTTGR